MGRICNAVGAWLRRRRVESATPWALGFVDGVVGLWAASGLAPLLETPIAYLALMAVVVFASLLPDIDHQSSRINRLFGTSRGLFGWLMHRFFKIFVGPHRTVTHYGLTWLALSLIVWIGLPAIWSPGGPYAFAFSIGYGLHISRSGMACTSWPTCSPSAVCRSSAPSTSAATPWSLTSLRFERARCGSI